jgi:hypothetical protein
MGEGLRPILRFVKFLVKREGGRKRPALPCMTKKEKPRDGVVGEREVLPSPREGVGPNEPRTFLRLGIGTAVVAKGFRIRIHIAEPAAAANAGTYPESLHPRWRRFRKWSSHRRAG